jgi:hypothetical protein
MKLRSIPLKALTLFLTVAQLLLNRSERTHDQFGWENISGAISRNFPLGGNRRERWSEG